MTQSSVDRGSTWVARDITVASCKHHVLCVKKTATAKGSRAFGAFAAAQKKVRDVKFCRETGRVTTVSADGTLMVLDAQLGLIRTVSLRQARRSITGCLSKVWSSCPVGAIVLPSMRVKCLPQEFSPAVCLPSCHRAARQSAMGSWAVNCPDSGAVLTLCNSSAASCCAVTHAPVG